MPFQKILLTESRPMGENENRPVGRSEQAYRTKTRRPAFSL